MKNILNLTLVVFLSAFIFSCCKDPTCPGEQEKYYYLSGTTKALEPYIGHDTVRFKHSSGTLYTFIGQRLDSGFNIRASSASPDCPDNIITYAQYYKIKFYSIDFGTLELTKFLRDNATSDGSGELGVTYQGSHYVTDANFTRFQHNGISYFDSVNVNGKTYKDVAKLFYNAYWDSPLFVYYNLKDGIIKIVLNANRNEYLERIPE